MNFRKNYFSLSLCAMLLSSVAFSQAISIENLNFYGIKSANGKFWSVRSGGSIEAVGGGVGYLEVFIYEELDDTHFALRAMNNGKYIYCKDDKTTLAASRDVRASKETYEKTNLDGNIYSIRAHNNKYLRATDNGGGKIKADREKIGGHEQFAFVKLNKVRFITNNGSMLGEVDGQIKGKPGSDSKKSTLFSFETDGSRTYLKAPSGGYVSSNNGELIVVKAKSEATPFTYNIANTSPFYTIKFYDSGRNQVFAVGGGGFAVKAGNPSDTGWAAFKMQPVVE